MQICISKSWTFYEKTIQELGPDNTFLKYKNYCNKRIYAQQLIWFVSLFKKFIVLCYIMLHYSIAWMCWNWY